MQQQQIEPFVVAQPDGHLGEALHHDRFLRVTAARAHEEAAGGGAQRDDHGPEPGLLPQPLQRCASHTTNSANVMATTRKEPEHRFTVFTLFEKYARTNLQQCLQIQTSDCARVSRRRRPRARRRT